MSTSRDNEVITLNRVKSLNKPELNKKKVVWKEFGSYLEKNLEVEQTSEDNNNFAKLISKSLLDSSLLSQVIKYKICKSCNRPVGQDSLAAHYTRCVEMKNKSQDKESGGHATKKRRTKGNNAILDIEDSSVDSSRNTTPIPSTPASAGTTGARPKKKYKKSQTQKEKEAANAAAAAAAAASNGDGSVGRKKRPPKVKNQTKQKGPVDVERQCGVPLPSGGYCARSLTCKTHSMGAKRAVPGRSAPYDVLLQQYQKRNQAKLAANNALAIQRRENAAMNDDNDGSFSNNNYSSFLDPDEETHLVLEGVSKSHPMPLEKKVMISARSRHKFLYMREAYANALITHANNNLNTEAGQNSDQTLANQAISGSIGGLQGRCALVNVDAATNPYSDSVTQNYSTISGEMYQVRAPLKSILLTSQYNAMQQQLFQQQVMKLQMQQQMLLAKQQQNKVQQQAK